MELHWTPEAIRDREAIYDFIEADNPIAALALDELLEGQAARLIDHPVIGRLGHVPSCPGCLNTKYPAQCSKT